MHHRVYHSVLIRSPTEGHLGSRGPDLCSLKQCCFNHTCAHLLFYKYKSFSWLWILEGNHDRQHMKVQLQAIMPNHFLKSLHQSTRPQDSSLTLHHIRLVKLFANWMGIKCYLIVILICIFLCESLYKLIGHICFLFCKISLGFFPPLLSWVVCAFFFFKLICSSSTYQYLVPVSTLTFHCLKLSLGEQRFLILI